MSVRVLLLSFAVLAADHLSASDPEPPRSGGLKSLQGEWTVVSMETQGKQMPEKLREQYKLTIKGDQWVLSLAGKPTTATIKIDASKKPMTLDLTGQAKGATFRAIFKVEGDTFTLCRTTGKQDRPTKFEAEDKGVMLVVWKRVKK
jgi:uncharacterized protein (TIGR03067 family)